jgi:hypothetical protein
MHNVRLKWCVKAIELYEGNVIANYSWLVLCNKTRFYIFKTTSLKYNKGVLLRLSNRSQHLENSQSSLWCRRGPVKGPWHDNHELPFNDSPLPLYIRSSYIPNYNLSNTIFRVFLRGFFFREWSLLQGMPTFINWRWFPLAVEECHA